VANGSTGIFTTLPTPVSVSSSGVAGDHGGTNPAISSDGGVVAFESLSTNLLSTPILNTPGQVYFRRTCAGQNAGCSPSTALISPIAGGGPDLEAEDFLPAVSDDGRFVAFSYLGHLGVSGVLMYDGCISPNGPVTNCVPSVNQVDDALDSSHGLFSGSSTTPHAVSGDRRFVVFSSALPNLVTSAYSGMQVFVRDTCNSSSGPVSGCTPQTVLISADSTCSATGGCNAAIS
jgi:hypothetical protein